MLALLVLLVGLPAYVVAALALVDAMGRPHPALELGIYVGLGVLWALPLKRLFLGIAKAPPDAAPTEAQGSGANRRADLGADPGTDPGITPERPAVSAAGEGGYSAPADRR